MTSACLLASMCGCARDAAPPPVPAARTDDVSLGVLVVGEPELARSIGRLRGDWAELSGGSLRVEEVPIDRFRGDEPLSADVVIYPARYLGALLEHKRIRPLRSSVLDDEQLAFHEILPAIREGELAYGGEYYAVPFGSRVLVTVSANDGTITAVDGNQSPEAVEPTSSPGDLPELPEGEFAAALVLLAHAAPRAKHPRQLAVLFDLDSMEPQIDGPPFVESLEELAVIAAEGPPDGPPSRSRWRWWPPADREPRSPGGRMANLVLPESDRVYDPDTATWEQPAGDVSRAPLVGARSHVGSVSESSRNAPAAFRLLTWLAGGAGQGGGRVSLAPYREGAADDLAEGAFTETDYLHVPRILEVDAYFSALDASVRRALKGELAPAEALREAAREWDEITDRVGRQRQQTAYRRHLNLP